jgi:hypothetical protein
MLVFKYVTLRMLLKTIAFASLLLEASKVPTNSFARLPIATAVLIPDSSDESPSTTSALSAAAAEAAEQNHRGTLTLLIPDELDTLLYLTPESLNDFCSVHIFVSAAIINFHTIIHLLNRLQALKESTFETDFIVHGYKPHFIRLHSFIGASVQQSLSKGIRFEYIQDITVDSLTQINNILLTGGVDDFVFTPIKIFKVIKYLTDNQYGQIGDTYVSKIFTVQIKYNLQINKFDVDCFCNDPPYSLDFQIPGYPETNISFHIGLLHRLGNYFNEDDFSKYSRIFNDPRLKHFTFVTTNLGTSDRGHISRNNMDIKETIEFNINYGNGEELAYMADIRMIAEFYYIESPIPRPKQYNHYILEKRRV